MAITFSTFFFSSRPRCTKAELYSFSGTFGCVYPTGLSSSSSSSSNTCLPISTKSNRLSTGFRGALAAPTAPPQKDNNPPIWGPTRTYTLSFGLHLLSRAKPRSKPRPRHGPLRTQTRPNVHRWQGGRVWRKMCVCPAV